MNQPSRKHQTTLNKFITNSDKSFANAMNNIFVLEVTKYTLVER
jgi:hypothetical protein